MNDDELLAALARRRQEQELDETDDERLRPLDAAEQEAIVSRLLGGAAPAAQGPAPAEVPAAKVVQFPTQRRRPATWAISVGALAAAAAVALVVLRPAKAPLPEYELVTLAGGAHETRDDVETATWTFRPDTRLDLALRPREAVPAAAELELRAWLVRGERVLPAAATITRDPGGAVRLTGLAREAFPGAEPGDWTLALVVARPADVPEPETLRQAVTAGAGPDPARWRLFTQKLRLVSP